MAPSTFSFHPSTLMAAGSTSPRSGFPDGAILCSVPRISKHRNATTAGCESSEGHTVEVSFWLVDPPGVSYFSVNCPGLDASHFADDMDPPSLICAEAAFVLFTVTVRGTTDHFVYTAAPAGRQSLQLLPDHNTGHFRKNPYALLPRGGDRYAVAFLDRSWISEDVGWQFDASIFSSDTQAWRRNRVSLQHLSESDKSLCGHHGLMTQIAVGGDSLGWVDLARGILLLQNLFDGHPVMRFIHLPKRVRFIAKDGLPYRPDEYYCNVACCDDLIKFILIEFDDPAIMTSGQGWRATVWNRNISGNKWRRRSIVDVANVSLDQSYSALLPALRDEETQRLELKRLIFYAPVLSVHNDGVFYMMAKVIHKDDTAWVIAVDMERSSVEAMAPFSVGLFNYLVTVYRPCVFPKYLNTTPGAGMGNPVDKCFKRLSADQCLVQVLWTIDWLRELDQCLIFERSTYNTCRLLLQLSPVSSLRSNIESMVKCASSCNGEGEAASRAVNFCLRALDDFDLALHESPSAASVEAIRRKISDVLKSLEIILRIVPPALMPREGTLGGGEGGEAISETREKPDNESDKRQEGTSKPSNSRAEKYQENKGGSDRKERRQSMVWDGRLLILIVCLLVSLIVVVMPSSPLNVRKAAS